MSTSIFQLLFVGLFVAFWWRFYLGQKARVKRESDSRRQTAAKERESTRQEKPRPEAVLVESEAVPVTVADLASNESAKADEPVRSPTGVVCVVRKARKRLRCTEFEVDGELKTEVCRVDKKGRSIGKPSFYAGPYRDVANELLNLKLA